MADKAVQFGVLGPLEARRDGRPVDLGTPKQRSVLAVLLINANNVVSVDRLVDALWGEEPAATATASLQVYISNLRRALEPDRPARARPQILLTQAPGYLVRVGDGDMDSAMFEALAGDGHRLLLSGDAAGSRAALVKALALWRGPALAEYAFEPFAEREAARLDELRQVAVETRIEADIALGAHAVAAAELEAVVGERPLRERLWALLMLALYRSGRQADALGAYTRARQTLIEQLGVEPGPELRAVHGGILAQTPALGWWQTERAHVNIEAQPPTSRSPAGDAGELVGRGEQVGLIDGALTHTFRGAGGVVLVSGEPGIGKTRLAEEMAGRAVARGALVVWGRGHEGEGAPPFWPWVQIIEALYDAEPEKLRPVLLARGAELAMVVPRLGQVIGPPPATAPPDSAAARFRLYATVADLLASVARDRPLVIILDDIHWADGASLELTAFVAEKVQSNPVLLLATHRDVDPVPDGDLTETLGKLARRTGVVRIALSGLDHSAVGRLIAQASGVEPTQEVAASVLARTEGNPFFVGEVARLLTAEGGLTGTSAAELPVPPGVQAVLRRRLARLPEATNALLNVAAVSGRAFHLSVLAAAAGSDDAGTLDLVDLAVAAGLVAEDTSSIGRFKFSHALVQETIYERISGLRRARLHADVAAAIEGTLGGRAEPAELANHYVLAVAVCGPERAIAALARAAEAAIAALAPEAAEEHLRRALALVEQLPISRDRDRTELDLQDRLATLLARSKGIGAPETGRASVRARNLSRDVDDRLRLLRSQWGVYVAALARSDFNNAEAAGREILDLGAGASDVALLVSGDLAVGAIAMFTGRLSDAHSHLARGKQAIAGTDLDLAASLFTDLESTLDSYLGLVLCLQGDPRQGLELGERAIDRARRLEDPFSIAVSLLFSLLATVVAREAEDEALSRCGQLLAHAEKYQLVDFAAPASLIQAWTSMTRPDGGRRKDERAATPGAQTYRPFRPLYFAMEAEIHAERGLLPAAHESLKLAFAEAASTGETFYLAELHRLQSDILARYEPESTAAAADHLQRAVAIADAQGALLFRRRAQVSIVASSSLAEVHRRRPG